MEYLHCRTLNPHLNLWCSYRHGTTGVDSSSFNFRLAFKLQSTSTPSTPATWTWHSHCTVSQSHSGMMALWKKKGFCTSCRCWDALPLSSVDTKPRFLPQCGHWAVGNSILIPLNSVRCWVAEYPSTFLGTIMPQYYYSVKTQNLSLAWLWALKIFETLAWL